MEKQARKKVIIGSVIGVLFIGTLAVTIKPVMVNIASKKTGLDKSQIKDKSLSDIYKISTGKPILK